MKIFNFLIAFFVLLLAATQFGCGDDVAAYDEPIKAITLPETATETDKVVLYDNFISWSNWENYQDGSVELSSEQYRSAGSSLKKVNNNDPHGGFKLLDQQAHRVYIFEGWIFRPSSFEGGWAERLAITDGVFNGYGITVTGETLYIERRHSGIPEETISTQVNWDRPLDDWYRFIFEANNNNTFTLTLFDKAGYQLATVTSEVDTTFSGPFDRIVIHGGHQYYVDELKLIIPRSGR